MSTARCFNCGKMLCQAGDDASLDVKPQAAQADKSSLSFFIKCPRCGKLNAINYIKKGNLIELK